MYSPLQTLLVSSVQVIAFGLLNTGYVNDRHDEAITVRAAMLI